jgi:zinc protease
MNERRQRVDNQPYGRASERLHEMLYPKDHPYHWPVIGYMEDIEAATLEDVQKFFRTYYTPNNAVLTLAGDFEPAAALARIEHYFGDIPSGPPLPPLPAVVTDLPPLAGGASEVIEDEVRLPRLYLGFRAPAYGARPWYAADLLAGVLSGGKSSVLYRDLVYDRQIVQDIGAYVDPTEAVATFAIIATARPGVPIETVEEGVAAHLARATQEPPAPEDLERACNKVLTEYYSGLQKLDNRADLFSQFTTFFDDPGGLAREAERYREVTGEDVAAYAADFLTPDRGVRVTVVPRSAA